MNRKACGTGDLTLSAIYPLLPQDGNEPAWRDIAMPVDQSGAAEYEAADVLFASTEVGASSASSVLKFNHALHRINIHLKGNIPDDLTIEVKSLAGGRISLEDGTVKADGDAGFVWLKPYRQGSLGLEGSSAKVALAACYPSQAVTRSGTFEFNPLTASEADLLLASAQTVTAGTSEAVNLVFNHALHRLDLNFTPGNSYTDEDMKSFSIRLQAKTTCVVDMMQGKIVGVKEDTGEYVSKETAASFYLVPQATTGIVMNITVGENTKSLTLSELLDQLSASQSDLSSGKFSKLTLKVSQEGITVEGGFINAWDNQVTADGEVVIG